MRLFLEIGLGDTDPFAAHALAPGAAPTNNAALPDAMICRV